MSLTSPAEVHERDSDSPFLDFLLAQPEIAGVDPSITDLHFDLDETMFRRRREYMDGIGSPKILEGSWRPEMAYALGRLKGMGFGLNLLSSADLPYIKAALEIYGEQFGEDAHQVFGRVESTGSYDPYGMKEPACYAVSAAANEAGRRAVFIDDSPLYLEEGDLDDFGYIRVYRENMFFGPEDGAPVYHSPISR